jgi:hypothetical protein
MLKEIRDRIREAGAQVWTEHNRDAALDALWTVQLDTVEAHFAVEYRRRAPYPSELDALEQARWRSSRFGEPLLAAPYISEGVGQALRQYGWSWADEQGNLDLRAPGLRLRHRVSRQLPRHRLAGFPRGGGGLAIVRALVWQFAWGSPRSSDLARRAGVSQARASQVLGQLERLDLIERAHEGWLPNREALLEVFLSQYRGPGGEETTYYSLDPPEQVAAKFLTRVSGRIAVSADVGPDLVASWRRPSHLVAYVRGDLELDGLPVTRSKGRADANIIVRQPADNSVFPIVPLEATLADREIPLADPLQMLWDLRDLGGEDRREAADHLREWILRSR